MNDAAARATVRSCLIEIKPEVDIDSVGDDTPLLEERLITSFDVMDLMLHLEQASGQRINPMRLVAGSFRDIRTIARVFLGTEAES